ncbi:MAG: helix-turn-helix domain-containing protein [bacterium]|nr:helix-turn-helix domain-containing protein [bacterium]
MKNVGEILKKARAEKNLTLEDVEKKTKIRAKFLAAIEESAYEKLPSAVYIRGFIKNYSEFLGLSPEKVLAIFRRQFDERKNLGLLPHGMVEPVKREPISLKKPPVIVLLFLLPLTIFFAYLYREYRQFSQPPQLTIYSPQEEAVISGMTLDVKGKADSSAILTLNGQNILLEEDGSFNQRITLTPGLNNLEFMVKNRLGKERKIERVVKVNP